MQRSFMIALAALTAASCGGSWDQKKVEARVAEKWRHCQIVIPGKVAIEAQDSKMIRYAYVLKMREDGVHAERSFPCFKPDQKIIEAMAHKDMVQIKKGEEIEMVEEVRK